MCIRDRLSPLSLHYPTKPIAIKVWFAEGFLKYMENLGLGDINRTANGKNNLLRKRSLEARPTAAKNKLRKNTLSELSDFLWNKLHAVYRLEAVDT